MNQPPWKIEGKRRQRLVKKLFAVHLKGGACAMCGDRQLENLEFHHPGNDRAYEAGLTTLSFKQILEEMWKVLLVCSKCHAILDQNRYPGQDEDQVTTPSETRHSESPGEYENLQPE